MIGSMSVSGASAAFAVQQAANSSIQTPPATTGTDSLLSYLTPGDRDLIFQATGTKIGPDGVNQDGRPLAPLLAFQIGLDRKYGTLPAGQPITSTYLRSLLQHQSNGGGSQDFTDNINKMLEVLAKQGGQERLDLRT